MEDNVKCMCEFNLSDLLCNLPNTIILQIMIDNGIKLNDIIMTIWFNETIINIFNLEYYLIKYIPVFIVDFDLSLECIKQMLFEIEQYVFWYESTIESLDEVVTTKDEEFYIICKSMVTEIKKQWI